MQVKPKFFSHLSGQYYCTPANIHSWRRNVFGFCFFRACTIWNGTWAPNTAAGKPLSVRKHQCLANTSQLRGAGQPPVLLTCCWWSTMVASYVNCKCQHLGICSNSASYLRLIPQYWNTEQLKPWSSLVYGISNGYLTMRKKVLNPSILSPVVLYQLCKLSSVGVCPCHCLAHSRCLRRESLKMQIDSQRLHKWVAAWQ